MSVILYTATAIALLVALSLAIHFGWFEKLMARGSRKKPEPILPPDFIGPPPPPEPSRLGKVWSWPKKLKEWVTGLWKEKKASGKRKTNKDDEEEFGPQWNRFESLVYSSLICVTVYVALLLVTYLLFGSLKYTVKQGQTELVWSWTFFHFIAVIIWIGSSFQTIDADTNGVKKCFGEIVQDLGPGLVFAPMWIFSVVKITAKLVTLVGGTPESTRSAERGERTTAGPDATTLKEGLSLSAGRIRVNEDPLRITFAEREKAVYLPEDKTMFEGSKNPLSSQHTTDPIIVMGILFPKSETRYLVRRFSKEEAAVREVAELMTSHLQLLCSKVTPEYFIYRIGEFSRMLQLILEKLLEDSNMMPNPEVPKRNLAALGIDIDDIKSTGKTGVNIKTVTLEAGLSKRVNEAFRDRVQSQIAIDVAANLAEAQKIKLTREGEGEAAATRAKKLAEAEGVRADLLAKAEGARAKLLAEAEGREALIKATDSAMGLRLAELDAVVTALKDNSKVVIARDSSEILGAIAKAQQTIKRLTEENPVATGTGNPNP